MHIQSQRFYRIIVGDILAACAVIAAWCLALESRYGGLCLLQRRVLTVQTGLNFREAVKTAVYSFHPADSTALYSIDIGQILTAALTILPIIFSLQLISLLISGWKNERFLRRIMRPIDEAALEAERIAAGAIDQQRLHDMEKAIDSITGSQDTVRIGDADLRGLESAINNLLRRLKASYEEQTRFVDDASHELRTPIAVIHGYASILERWGKNDPETLDESIRAILDESEHMQTLVDQLLFLARGDGGRQQLSLEPLDANLLLHEIAEESAMIDSGHQYGFTPGPAAWVMADSAMLKQAIRILTDNAAKYTPSGGNIRFSAAQTDGGVAISVSDEGVGLRQEDAARMFERFFRGDRVRGSTKGSGLGLSIAKWIVEHHGGHIEVLSYADIGTRISICLPAANAPGE